MDPDTPSTGSYSGIFASTSTAWADAGEREQAGSVLAGEGAVAGSQGQDLLGGRLRCAGGSPTCVAAVGRTPAWNEVVNVEPRSGEGDRAPEQAGLPRYKSLW